MPTLLALSLALVLLDELPAQQADVQPAPLRFIELTGDDLLDRLHIASDGTVWVSVNLGGGVFDPIVQELPNVLVAHVLAGDLNGDTLVDLYLVSPGDNVALLGDGTGRFSDGTEWLGLADGGPGLSAERVDLDGLGAPELLLHNAGGDVNFWHVGNGFQRDAETPAVVTPSAQMDQPALEHVAAQVAGLLALDQEGQIVVDPLHSSEPTDTSVTTSPTSGAGGTAPSGPLPGPSISPSPVIIAGPIADLDLRVTGQTHKRPGVTSAAPPPSFMLTSEQAEILDHMGIVYLDDGTGSLVNKTIRVSGVNWQIVNGSGTTSGLVDGLGNLIVGYNELSSGIFSNDRTGSHNLIAGEEQNYSSYGGLVAGFRNTISGAHAAVSGGYRNTASGSRAAVSGGFVNTASGANASVSGGVANTSSGSSTSVSGGYRNTASGTITSVSGGYLNTASGYLTSVSGGQSNQASGGDVYFGYYSAGGSISGGFGNTASGYSSSVSGGAANAANGSTTWVSGGRSNTVNNYFTSVSGGVGNTASGSYSSVSGGYGNTASGNHSTVSGGNTRTASGTDDWVAGSLFEDS